MAFSGPLPLLLLLLLLLFPLTLACEDGWVGINSSCYLYSTEGMSWYAGKEFCYNRGAYLAEIDTEDEQAALHLVLVHEVDYWVGLADFEEEGTFVWQESQAEPTYTNWVSGQPDSADGNEDCVYLHHQYDFAWTDDGCDYGMPHALCEAPRRRPGDP